MKYFVTGILILCTLIGLCWLSAWEITERTRQIAEPLEQALSAIQAGDNAKAQAYAAQATESWAASEAVLASFISHDHTNAIAEALAQLPWLRGPELGKALEALLTQLYGLAEMEQITWANIL